MGPQVVVLETPGLGDRSYLVHDGMHAVVVDPQRDVDRVERLIAEHGLTVTHVVETHIHNDYVTGGYQLAATLDARYVVPGGVELSYLGQPNVTAVGDGDEFSTGRLRVSVLHTPGHTPHHISFAVRQGDEPGVVFTGGSLLYGTVGRPDLVAPDLTVKQAHDQWHSARRLVADLDEDTAIFPTHGFGSFCSSIQAAGTQTSLGQEKAINPALIQSEKDFVDILLAGLDVFPAYYAHMGPANALGPAPIDLTLPGLADPVEIRRRIQQGEWVIDLRGREAFDTAHVPGSLNFDLAGAFVSYLGWMVPWGTPITLLGDTPEQVQVAQRELVRIGIDRPVGQATGDPTTWIDAGTEPARTRRVDFEQLAQEWAATPGAVVIDTRQILEWEAGHVPGATFIPFYEVLDRLAEIPHDVDVYVYCGSGYRASVVVSLLQNRGFDNVIHVDDMFANAGRYFTLESEEPAPREPGWTWIASRSTVRTFSSEELNPRARA